MSASSVVNRQKEMADGLQNVYEEVAASIKTAARRNIDETGWREAGKRSQLWGVVSESATLFRIVASRASTVAKDLLGADSHGITAHRHGHDAPLLFAPLEHGFFQRSLSLL